jgi:hypothetical protein
MIEMLSPAPTRTRRAPDRIGWRPGIQVAIAAHEAGAAIVRVSVDGAQGPFRLYLYVDGELTEAWIPAAEMNELPCPALLSNGRHTVTARAIDALGRWGAASMLTPTA